MIPKCSFNLTASVEATSVLARQRMIFKIVEANSRVVRGNE